MSALGQKRTFAPQKAMSALPPIATAKGISAQGDVCFTPESGQRFAQRQYRHDAYAQVQSGRRKLQAMGRLLLQAAHSGHTASSHPQEALHRLHPLHRRWFPEVL